MNSALYKVLYIVEGMPGTVLLQVDTSYGPDKYKITPLDGTPTRSAKLGLCLL